MILHIRQKLLHFNHVHAFVVQEFVDLKLVFLHVRWNGEVSVLIKRAEKHLVQCLLIVFAVSEGSARRTLQRLTLPEASLQTHFSHRRGKVVRASARSAEWH